MSQCTNCPQLQAEITRLQLEVSMLLRIIGAARSECLALVNEADRAMSGHVARGIWAHATGQKKAAQRVLRKLEH